MGTTVEVYLPAQVPDLHIPLLQRRLAHLPTRPTIILLLWAEVADRELLRAMLIGGSHTVVATEDGAEALACVIEYQATLGVVVLDLALPTFNGGAMGRRLEQRIPQVPILTLDRRRPSAPVPDPETPPRASRLASPLTQLAKVLS